jgi:hypothetical protein
MKQYEVFPECYVDTNLVSYLIGGNVKHKSSCNEVAKAINQAQGFAIGIIDADKREPIIDKGFGKVSGMVNPHLTMYVHSDKRRYLFKVGRAMDQFVYDIARQEGVKLSEFDLSEDFEKFKKTAKSIQSGTDGRLRRLFEEIKNNEELLRFRNTLKYLVNKQMQADPEMAKKFFNGSLTKDDLTNVLQEYLSL